MRLCNRLGENGSKMIYKVRALHSDRARGVFRLVLGAIFLSALLVGCGHAPAHAAADEAFALVYPELSSRLIREFPTIAENKKNPSPYLSYPPQSEKIESFLTTSESKPSSSLASDKQKKELPVQVFVTTPAVTGVFPPARLGENVVLINLLAPTAQAQSCFSVEWNSAWAYRELGLIVGYRLASLRHSGGGNASAAILFSVGIGRSLEELSAFTESFKKGFLLASSNSPHEAPAENTLLVFDLESMRLPGDQLEQTLSALRQIEEKKPRILVLASGSRLAFEKSLAMKEIEISADLRGLGTELSTKDLFAAIEENDVALVSAARHLARELGARKNIPNITLVKPSLALSKEARKIRASLPEQP